MAEPTSNQKRVQAGIKKIDQDFKERDIAARAKEIGMSYVNLIETPINSDLAKVITQKESEVASAVAFLKIGKKLRIAVVDPEKAETKGLIEKLKTEKYEVNVSLCSEESLASAQRIYFSSAYVAKEALETQVAEEDLGSFAQEIQNLAQLKDKIEESSFDVALNYVQVGACKSHATDVHFQPEESYVLVRFRIDGILAPVFHLSKKIYDGILKEIKQLSHLKLNVSNVPQDGQYSFTINERAINVRVSILPTHYGETCVMRLLDPNKGFVKLEELGFEGQALEYLKQATTLPHGLILVTGPTGSGKTTTLYSILQSIDTEKKKVITLEDPIEYNLEGISQSQVDHDAEYDFATGLRAILRQDPDVIMVGEIRDLETAETAAQASLTGHLVFSTLHTNSAIESIPRLANMGVKSFILAPAVELIIAQRLVRKLCEVCSKEEPITDVEKQHIQEAISALQNRGVQTPAVPDNLRRPKGCEKCGQTGYNGQLAVAEVLKFNAELRDLILEQKPMPEIYDYIDKKSQMISMNEDGILKVIRGVTTLDEVYRVSA